MEPRFRAETAGETLIPELEALSHAILIPRRSPRLPAPMQLIPPKKRIRARYTARTADRFELYQLAVQSPEPDLAFLSKVYRRWNGKAPLHLREDFCGTAFLSATWAKRSGRTAEGFDLDPESLAWGTKHNLEPLGPAAARVELHTKDVRAKGRRPADLRVAQNFSYWIFKERDELLDYFRRARAGLARDGLFAIDAYGGADSISELVDVNRIDEGFTYVWDQEIYLPGTGETTNHIHFRFRDGSEMRRAFTYHWRFWNLPELADLLREAGFARVETWFEQGDDDNDGQGNGSYALDPTGETCRDCSAWIAYLVAGG